MTDPAPARQVSDRRVVALMVVVVTVVLGANLLSAAVPGLDALLAGAPVLVVLLLAGTSVVLVAAFRRPPRAERSSDRPPDRP